MSGRERPRGNRSRADELLRQALDHRTRVPRHQRPAFRHGFVVRRIGKPTRRDRLLLVSTFAMALLTLLGSVGESLGMDQLLKSNTSKTRTHSLFRQGCMLYEIIPNMPELRLISLMTSFAKAISQTSVFSKLLAHLV